jgi:hypothetical protein
VDETAVAKADVGPDPVPEPAPLDVADLLQHVTDLETALAAAQARHDAVVAERDQLKAGLADPKLRAALDRLGAGLAALSS